MDESIYLFASMSLLQARKMRKVREGTEVWWKEDVAEAWGTKVLALVLLTE